jgi:hypothetical protein
MPDRVAIEAELTGGELATIREWCERIPVPVAAWPDALEPARPFLFLAAYRLADRLRESRGLAKDAALAEACARLGLSPETLTSWRKRWRRRAYQRKRCRLHREAA